MIYLAAVAIINAALAAWLVYENRKLTYAAIARHTGDIAVIERSQHRPRKASTEDEREKPYTSWRSPDEGVGP